MPKIASLAHWQCSYWSRSVSESKSTLGFRIPSKPNPATRSGLGSFLHPPSRKTPTPLSVKMFAVAAQTTVRATAQVKATKVAAKQQKSASISSKAAGAAAALFLFASPAMAGDGLTLLNGTNSAPGKYEQPFYDPRPVVEVEKDSSALISTEAARVAANKQKGAKNCKTITGAPCVASQDIGNQ